MTRVQIIFAIAALLGPNCLSMPGNVAAKEPAALHCEVPCGIYNDQMRFEQMLEDTETISKAITAINEYAADPASRSATHINQVVRWVTTKDDHATNTQHIVAQYFLTQRIKPENERYDEQLRAAHTVLVAAMKCKQDADPATAESLRNAILDLYRAYEGKEPQPREQAEGAAK